MNIPKVNIAALVDELDHTNWRKLKADLSRAVDRERSCGTNRPDGYSASTMPDSGTSGISDPTMTTYLARQQASRDQLRASTVDAVLAVLAAANALSRARRLLKKMDDSIADLPVTPKGCDLCTMAGLKQDGQPIPWEHRGNVAGRLTTDHYLCGPHYYFVYNRGFAPSSEQTRHWYVTGTWKIRLDPQTASTARLLA